MRFDRKALNSAMFDKGWKQGDLAERSGVSQSAISGLLRGVTTKPNLETINALARALGINPLDLLEEEDEDHAAA